MAQENYWEKLPESNEINIFWVLCYIFHSKNGGEQAGNGAKWTLSAPKQIAWGRKQKQSFQKLDKLGATKSNKQK